MKRILSRLRASVNTSIKTNQQIVTEEALQRIMDRRNDIPKYKPGTIEILECMIEVVSLINNELNDDVKLDMKKIHDETTEDRNITIFIMLRKSMMESIEEYECMY